MKKRNMMIFILAVAMLMTSCGKKNKNNDPGEVNELSPYETRPVVTDKNGNRISGGEVPVTDSSGKVIGYSGDDGNYVIIPDGPTEFDEIPIEDGFVDISIDPDSEEYDAPVDKDDEDPDDPEDPDQDGDDDEDGEAEEDDESIVGEFTHGDMRFHIAGSNYELFNSADALLESLDEPDFINELSEHTYNGNDASIYSYYDMTISVYNENDSKYIYEILFDGDEYTTDRGLSIGDDVNAVRRIYGYGSKAGNNIYFYDPDDDERYMYVVITSDIVSAIGYATDI